MTTLRSPRIDPVDFDEATTLNNSYDFTIEVSDPVPSEEEAADGEAEAEGEAEGDEVADEDTAQQPAEASEEEQAKAAAEEKAAVEELESLGLPPGTVIPPLDKEQAELNKTPAAAIPPEKLLFPCHSWPDSRQASKT